jgi:hypothetical protein
LRIEFARRSSNTSRGSCLSFSEAAVAALDDPHGRIGPDPAKFVAP